MDSFAAVIRTLLVRIRALQSSRPGNPWPPSAAAGLDLSLYRVTPTAWGVEPAGALPAAAPAPGGLEIIACCKPPGKRRRRRLEIPIFRLPVPRGLPAT